MRYQQFKQLRNKRMFNKQNTWLPRSFASNQADAIFNTKPVFYISDSRSREDWVGNFSMTSSFQQNFGKNCNSCKSLGAMPFWSGTNTMTVGNGDGRANLDAYQFGLGDIVVDENGIGGTISLDPRVQQAGTNMQLFFAQHKNERGFYFKINAALGAMMIDPRMKQTGIELVDSNYFSQTATGGAGAIQYAWANTSGAPTPTITNSYYPSVERRYPSLVSAFAGGISATDGALDGNDSKPVGLLRGKISSCKRSVVRLADLAFVLGYNVYASEKGSVGIAFKTTCPTGNVPTADYALEPIFGRAGAWGNGGEIMAHYRAWENDEQSSYLDVWLESEVLHLSPNRKPNLRSFDLKQNGAGSKYLLLQYYQSESDGSKTPSYLAPAVNVTTLPVISKFDVEGSVALMFDFHKDNWNVGVGTEFWARSHEKLCIDFCSAIDRAQQNLNDFAVVGRQVSHYDVVGSTSDAVVARLAQPLATISTSLPAQVLNGSTINNLAVPALTTGIADASLSANRIPANLNDALDIAGAAAARAWSGKVFGQVGYTWNEHRYAPSVSVGGSAEFSNSNNAVQFWGVQAQGSLQF